MKHAIISFIIALCVAVFAPQNLSELGAHITRAAVLMLRFGMALDPPHRHEQGYDAGEEGDLIPYLEQARAEPA